MKKLTRVLLMLGVVIGGWVAYWWLREGSLPTLRISHTVGKGTDVSVEWIEIG